MDGITLLEKICKEMPGIPVMVITGEEEIDIGLSAVDKGAYSYLTKPFKLQDVAVNIEGAFRRQRLEKEARNYQQELMENLEQKERQLNHAEENIKKAKGYGCACGHNFYNQVEDFVEKPENNKWEHQYKLSKVWQCNNCKAIYEIIGGTKGPQFIN